MWMYIYIYIYIYTFCAEPHSRPLDGRLRAGSQKASAELIQSSVATLLNTDGRINAISGQLVSWWPAGQWPVVRSFCHRGGRRSVAVISRRPDGWPAVPARPIPWWPHTRRMIYGNIFSADGRQLDGRGKRPILPRRLWCIADSVCGWRRGRV